MALSLDPQLAADLQPMFAAMSASPPLPPGDWKKRRQTVEGMFAQLAALAPAHPDVTTKSFATKSYDGASIHLRWFEKSGAAPGSAVLYLHGGGIAADVSHRATDDRLRVLRSL